MEYMAVATERAKRGGRITAHDQGCKGDGVWDDGPTLAGIANDFVIGRGVFRVATSVPINRPICVDWGGKIKVAAGAHLELNEQIFADPRQQIFELEEGATLTGNFGGAPVSPCWWGAKPDAQPDGTSIHGGPAFNSLAAFRACIAARTRARGRISKIEMPTGRFFISGAARPAVPNPDWFPGSGLPKNLIEAGLLQTYVGDCMVGGGWDASTITVGSLSSGTVLACGGIDTQGPPSEIGRFMIVAQEGGAYACDGIGLFANGARCRDVWFSGFRTGLHVASTSQEVDNFVGEFCQEAVRVSRGTNTVARGEMHANGNGVVAEHWDDQGKTLMDNLRVINPLGNQPSTIAFAFTGLHTRVAGTNLHAEGPFFTLGFMCAYCPEVELDTLSAKLFGNADGLLVGAVKEATIKAFRGKIMGPAPDGTLASSSAGIKIVDGSQKVQIMGGAAEGFITGAYNNTAGDRISYTGFDGTQNIGWGMDTVRATTLTVQGGHFTNNSVGGIRDIMNTADSHTYSAVMGMRGGAATQSIGIRTEINHVGGRIRIVAGSQFRENATAQQSAGGNYTSSPQLVVSSDCVTS